MRGGADLARLQACAEGSVRMNIVFRGAADGCGTTSNMAAVAGFLALTTGRRTVCMQPKEGRGDLESFFCPWEKRSVLREESAYYALEGMDYLIWQEQHHRLDAAVMAESLVPVMDHRLYYLPGGTREKPGLYPAQTGKLQRRIVARMEEYAELLFIDIGSRQDGCAQGLLERADVVVVNFSGERRELEQFFCSPLPQRGNVLYLLANYCSDQVYNSENLRRIYRMDRRSICTIPANMHFAQACARGRLEPFLKKNCHVRGVRRDAPFFTQLRHVSNLILEVGAHG